MSEPEPIGQSTERVSPSYESLTSRYPVDPLLGQESLKSKTSFPDWEVTDDERNWAKSYLSLGTNDELLENFGKYVGFVGKKGLQLLRDSSVQLSTETLDGLRNDLSQDKLLSCLRSQYQSDVLFFEEGLRGSRDVEDKYWNDEDDGQLVVARNWLKKSKSAFREMNDFMSGKTNKLSSVRVFAGSNFKAEQNATINNENYFRQNSDVSTDTAKQVLDQHSQKMVFWSSVNSFVDNLELSKEQK